MPIIVAINKIDKPGADPTRVKNELMEHGLVAEEYGGDTIMVEVSAKKQINIKDEITLPYTIYPADTTQRAFRWESSDENVLTVDQYGKITAKGLGTASITITSIYNENVKDTKSIYVKGYDIEYDVAPNTSNAQLLEYVPVDYRTRGCLYEVTDIDGNYITDSLWNIEWPIRRIAHVKCSYPIKDVKFTFNGNKLVSRVR